MSVTKPWYDTKEGIEASPDNGLEGIRKLSEERYEAGYKRRERPGWWCFRARNEADGLPSYDEREDSYVASCDGCGHDMGE